MKMFENNTWTGLDSATSSNVELGATALTIVEDFSYKEGEGELYYTLFAPMRILIGFASLFGNTLVITAVVKYEDMRTCTNILISALSAADLLVGKFEI